MSRLDPHRDWRFFSNGSTLNFITSEPKHIFNKPLTVLYAGNIGEGQGLHLIIPPLAKILEDKIIFKVIGDGGRKKHLKNELKRLNCKNVELYDPIPRENLIEAYQAADILFLHLNDYQAFTKVLPSKLFEYAASYKPIWAGLRVMPLILLIRK